MINSRCLTNNVVTCLVFSLTQDTESLLVETTVLSTMLPHRVKNELFVSYNWLTNYEYKVTAGHNYAKTSQLTEHG